MARRNLVEFLITAKDTASVKFQKVESSIGGVNSAVTRLASVTAGVFGTSELLQYADSFRLLQNRMRLVTDGSEQLALITDELTRVSRETRSSFESTANLYARVARSSRELGLTQRELIDFTTTVQQSIRISGSTAAEASAGVIQFGQALASSRLSGDELRSVLEQMPRLAQAIAEGMGVGIGRLREMGEAGELTAEAVLNALRKSAPEIAEEFEKLKPLVSEAFVVLKSSLMVAIGTIDQAAGISEDFAKALLAVSDQIILFGDAVTGNLDAKEIADIGVAAQLAAVGLAGIAFALKSIKDVADVGSSMTFDLIRNFVSQLATEVSQNTQYGADVAGAWSRALEDTISGTSDSIEDNVGDMTDNIEDFMNVWNNAILGIEANPVLADLDTRFGSKLDEGTRKQREAMARAAKEADKFTQSIADNANALVYARDKGIEFADALKLVKFRQQIAASGLAEGGQEYADYVERWFLRVQEMIEEFNANVKLTDLQNSFIDQGEAMALAREQGISYSDALEVLRIRALGAAAGNAQLGENLAETYIALTEQQAILQATEQVKDLQTNIEQQASALKIAEEFGIKYSDALQLIKNRAILAKAGQEELADSITSLQIEQQIQIDQYERQMQFMENLGERAAQNIQDAFANFLFDPFDKGVRGMLISFIDALRKMLAQALAFKILSGFNWFTNLTAKSVSDFDTAATFSSSPTPLATGGPVKKDMPILVGERGPEIFESIDRKQTILVGEQGPEFLMPKVEGVIRNESITRTILEDISLPKLPEFSEPKDLNVDVDTPEFPEFTFTPPKFPEIEFTESKQDDFSKAFDKLPVPKDIPVRASGGPVMAGAPVLVGEQGPELFVPSASGIVKSNTALKSKDATAGMQFITNIDARGADPGLIARLPSILENRDRQLMANVKRYIDTGIMPI